MPESGKGEPIRAESHDDTKLQAIREFAGIPVRRLEVRNAARTKRYRNYYREFIDRIRLPPGYIDRMYGSRLARHFYTLKEITRFRQRWTR